ncbi:ATP-dependent RNA helicase RhlE [Pontibacter ummariensis]|uniref:ATP-dependent RNA helicase RhlE n=1 Tax=Pontibacter ummariensis TaxID=1610492 RepID=A0A239JLK2_9BACT|nr:DEAD/DEAH box helicase [Pontibacter ummariensis]PRY07883.1 ATP-dependent RNA helicase RhlE [Pontibacter ummariensis]SNT06781.1 ATP-dependent RNA helicase RhlE [Pontibacter ummariensis]
MAEETEKENITFEDFKLNKQLLNAIEEAGYDKPTPIQLEAIPVIMGGHDILGIAQTGTGKTAAYLLPLLMKVKYAQGTNPRALILAPTRELAMQIEENIGLLAKYTDLRFAAIYGGVGPKTQLSRVHEGIDILVATPKRLMEFYLKGELVLKELKTMVLDEADKMMDMGFMPQIRQILEVIPRKRQNLLFSATMPDKVVELSEEFLEFPTRVEITPQATPVETVSQVLYKVPNLRTKIELLEHLIQDTETFNRVIIFTRSKKNAESVSKFLEHRNYGEVRAIHGNKGQNTRINSMEAFKGGEVRFLVATDVASRGIDVSMVSHVINFDVPLIYEDYVHRIGRTGRAENEGAAITFATEAEMYHVHKIEKIIRMQIPQNPMPAEVKVFETPFEEQQEMARDVDRQKRRENPDFKGAFHEKKGKHKSNFEKGRKSKGDPRDSFWQKTKKKGSRKK